VHGDGDALPTKDHLIPETLGGPLTLWNLRLSHYGCNSRRDNAVPPPRMELMKYVDMRTYKDMVVRYERAYGVPFGKAGPGVGEPPE
jgi:hypothetical protein